MNNYTLKSMGFYKHFAVHFVDKIRKMKIIKSYQDNFASFAPTFSTFFRKFSILLFNNTFFSTKKWKYFSLNQSIIYDENGCSFLVDKRIITKNARIFVIKLPTFQQANIYHSIFFSLKKNIK